MNRIAEVFGTSPVLLPVVHPISREAALEAICVAHTCGVKGVFLIDQGMSEREVLQLAREVRDQYPSLWIGLNLLSRTAAKTLTTTYNRGWRVDGIWSDWAGIEENRVAGSSHPVAEAFLNARRNASWEGLYFGGVAFKYQREVAPSDLAVAAEMSVPYMDVLCTSGPGTGHPADIEKVRALRAGLGDHAMALASGITPENVQSYMPYVQAFLVGTGIESQLGVFDPTKIEALMRAMGHGG
ncbi:MAG: adenine phosphoribosyltransferase [Acidobacteria bacterium]|nr:adenine phosphoribosyltransferase [Acidobacteriota bacterium]